MSDNHNRRRLPNRRQSEAFSFELAGQNYVATTSRFPDGRLAEIFLDAGKTGSGLQIASRDAAILASLLLQHGVAVETLLHSVEKLEDGSPAGPIGRAFQLVAMARE